MNRETKDRFQLVMTITASTSMLAGIVLASYGNDFGAGASALAAMLSLFVLACST